jgi:hypothetical protein
VPAPKIPHEKVRRLVRQGLTPKQIAETLLAEDDIRVTPAAIGMWRKRQGIAPTMARHAALLPWKLRREHKDLWPAVQLRTEGMRRRGEKISPRQAKSLDDWIANLEAQNAVVHYDRDSENGFYNVPRREGVDLDLIRDPTKEDPTEE